MCASWDREPRRHAKVMPSPNDSPHRVSDSLVRTTLAMLNIICITHHLTPQTKRLPMSVSTQLCS